MSTLKVVCDALRDSCNYLTAGKVYEVQMMADGHHGGDIIDDEGDQIFIVFEQCTHLGFGSWRVVE